MTLFEQCHLDSAKKLGSHKDVPKLPHCWSRNIYFEDFLKPLFTNSLSVCNQNSVCQNVYQELKSPIPNHNKLNV